MDDRDRLDSFTEQAKKVLNLAEVERQRFQDSYIDTEHLLLGLVGERAGVAAKVLTDFGVDLNKVRRQADFVIDRGASTKLRGPSRQFSQRGTLSRTRVTHVRLVPLGQAQQLHAREVQGPRAGWDSPVADSISLTPCAKKMIAFAASEARRLNYESIGTGHLLLGLVRAGEDISVGVLESLEVNREQVRKQTLQILSRMERF